MNKFLVLKWEDVERSGSAPTVSKLLDDMHRFDPKTVQHNYIVVNKDEPYADKVQALIEDYDRQREYDIRRQAIDQCDGEINCSAGSCLADKEIRIDTHSEGAFPTPGDVSRHINAIYETNHSYNQTWHRATTVHDGRIRTRLMVGQADLMLNQKQVHALGDDTVLAERPVETLVTPANARG